MPSKPSSSAIDGSTSEPQLYTTDSDGSTCPAPLDCDDLGKTLRIDLVVAFHKLMTLTPAQLNLQALAYAAYLNQLHGLDLDIDDILASWQRRIKHIQRIA